MILSAEYEIVCSSPPPPPPPPPPPVAAALSPLVLLVEVELREEEAPLFPALLLVGGRLPPPPLLARRREEEEEELLLLLLLEVESLASSCPPCVWVGWVVSMYVGVEGGGGGGGARGGGRQRRQQHIASNNNKKCGIQILGCQAACFLRNPKSSDLSLHGSINTHTTKRMTPLLIFTLPPSLPPSLPLTMTSLGSPTCILSTCEASAAAAAAAARTHGPLCRLCRERGPRRTKNSEEA